MIQQAIEVTRKQGKILIYATYPKRVNGIDFQDVHRRELTIYGASGAPRTYETAINLISTRMVRVKEMLTHTFKLEGLEEAFKIAERKQDGYIKGVVLI